MEREKPAADTASLPSGAAPVHYRVKDLPERLRPRELMDRVGVEHLGDDDLIAVLLGQGAPGQNVMEMAAELLARFHSLTGLAAAAQTELQKIRGMGKVKSKQLKAALEMGRRLQEEALGAGFAIRSPEDVFRLLGARVRGMEAEVFWALHLSIKNTLKGEPFQVSRGLLDASLVHPREVFREAIRAAAAAVVVVHNHPSGDVSPSAEDMRITKQLIEAGRVVDIRVLDHVILAGGGDATRRRFLSMREEGLVDF